MDGAMAEDNIQCELITWQKFMSLCRDLAFKIKDAKYQPDMIIAIGRGGYTPARMLSDYLDIDNLTSFKIEHYKSAHKYPEAIIKYPLSADINQQRILLVDDVSDTGDTYKVALAHLAEKGEASEIRTVALHYKVASSYEPDYYAEKIVNWRWLIYPWAVYEDVSGFINKLTPTPESIGDIQQQLLEKHNIMLPTQLLSDIIQLMQR